LLRRHPDGGLYSGRRLKYYHIAGVQPLHWPMTKDLEIMTREEPNVSAESTAGGEEAVTLAQKIAFLGSPAAYAHAPTEVARRETHMSWIFLAGDRVYKLKKPVRFPYLDFSTLARREAACRAELRLNRRLAPDVYLEVAPLTMGGDGLRIGGGGAVIEWLVVMRRLDERHTLEHAIQEDGLEHWQLDRLASTLIQFYRQAGPVLQSAASHLRDWRESLRYNHRVLLDRRLQLPAGLVHRADAIQRRFLAYCSAVLVQRVRRRKIVDGHGDLRPEHIWLGDPIRIIDCLEFNARLRAVDPFDEIAFLSLECERLGAAWAGRFIRQRTARGLRDGLSEALFLFYRCHRATLRARLAIAHLLEAAPRTPEKWPRLARAYLRIANADAARLARALTSPAGRPRTVRGAAVARPRRGAARRAARRSSRAPRPAR
jgi:aminoglycoside phosphotransferase family enzyme